MAQFPAMPLWTDAYLGDTLHLSLEEHGAYLKLLMIMWRSDDGCILDDDRRISTMLGITLKKWTGKIKPAIWPFLEPKSDGKVTQKKLQKVRKNALHNSKQQSQNAKARWLKNKESDDAPASNRHCDGNANHIHIHNHKIQDTNVSCTDDEKWIWSEGLDYLISHDGDERRQRSLVGAWLRDHPPDWVRGAIEGAMASASGKPAGYIVRILQNKRHDADATQKALEREKAIILRESMP